MKLLRPATILLLVCLVATSTNAQYQPQQNYQPRQYQPQQHQPQQPQQQPVQYQPAQGQPVQQIQPGQVQPGQVQPGQGFVPQGFQLNQVEQTYLDQVLDQWEKQSSQVSTFYCKFTRLAYDPVFGPGASQHKHEESGVVSYQKPDKGSFQIKKVKAWDAAKQEYLENPNIIGEHWVCDGKSVFEYKNEQKLLVERPIPPNMQGKSIVDGPLPFLFGAEAAKLKARYWMRIDHRSEENQIRLVAAPKRQSDAMNYRFVELMLDKQKMLPVAMQVHLPNQSRAVYTFDIAGAKVNNRINQLWNQMFQTPRTPLGWKKVVEDPTTQQMAQPNQGAALR